MYKLICKHYHMTGQELETYIINMYVELCKLCNYDYIVLDSDYNIVDTSF